MNDFKEFFVSFRRRPETISIAARVYRRLSSLRDSLANNRLADNTPLHHVRRRLDSLRYIF
jgi:hypothetical protein